MNWNISNCWNDSYDGWKFSKILWGEKEYGDVYQENYSEKS